MKPKHTLHTGSSAAVLFQPLEEEAHAHPFLCVPSKVVAPALQHASGSSARSQRPAGSTP